jgi:hypothetical protein
MPSLAIRLTVPIPVERTVAVPALIFARWLPLAEGDAIVVDSPPLHLRLWFDIESTRWASRVEVEDLPRHINVPVHRVYADVTLDDIEPSLLQYIQTRNYSQPVAPENEALQEAYDNLCWDVLQLSLRTVNRLTQYVRSRWGQHWLQEYEAHRGNMYSYFTQFEGKATLDHCRSFFRFSPTPLSSGTVRMESESRYVERDQWNEVRDYVLSKRRPPLSGALLAGAESLAANGHSRGAITEAVTALEVALFAFASDPNVDAALGNEMGPRLGLQSLKAQVERVGLTASFAYLLPILLPEPILPEAVLAGCREAISQRNSVVHSGQREVRDDVLGRVLAAVRSCCDILERHTGAGADSLRRKDREAAG